MFQCRIKPNRALNQLLYKGNTITKNWSNVETDLSLTNGLIECVPLKAVSEKKAQVVSHEPVAKKTTTKAIKSEKEQPKSHYMMSRQELLDEAEKMGINVDELMEKSSDEIIREIEIMQDI